MNDGLDNTLSGDIKKIDSITRIERLENINLKKKEWTLCCSHSSSEGIKYITQMFLMATVMIFCFIKLSLSDDSKETYIGLLSFILGVVLPSPQIKKKQELPI